MTALSILVCLAAGALVAALPRDLMRRRGPVLGLTVLLAVALGFAIAAEDALRGTLLWMGAASLAVFGGVIVSGYMQRAERTR